MAGYSGTPLPKKLGIKDGHVVALIGAPAAFEETLGPLPALVVVQRTASGRRSLDVIVAFMKSEAELVRSFAPLGKRLAHEGGLWIAWPKKASGIATDLTEGAVRARGLATGLVDDKVCAIDDVWSGLRFVYRLADRPPASPKRAASKPKARHAAPGRRLK